MREQADRKHLTTLPPSYNPSEPVEALQIPRGTNSGTLHFTHPVYPGLYEARFYANSDPVSLAGRSATFLAKVRRRGGRKGGRTGGRAAGRQGGEPEFAD